MVKVVIIGAGSTVFSKNVIADLLSFEALDGIHFALVDIDARRLACADAMTDLIGQTFGRSATTETHARWQDALPGADFVINMVDIGGYEMLKKEFDIPARYGLRQNVGDTLGLAGIFRAARLIPFVTQVAREIESVCPRALLINYSNPMGMACLAIFRQSGIQAVGICHGTQWTHKTVRFYAAIAELSPEERNRILQDKNLRLEWWVKCTYGFPLEETIMRCAGINHMNFVLDLRHKQRDLYPLLRRAADIPEIFQLDPVRLELMQWLGYYMTETSMHTAEYVPWYMHNEEEVRRLGIPVGYYKQTRPDKLKELDVFMRSIEGGKSPVAVPYERSQEYAGKIIHAIVSDRPFRFHGNVLNRDGRLISNLPAETCVEVPCLASGAGIEPTAAGALPAQCAALIRTNLNVQELTVLAIMERSRERLYQAAMMDPNASATLTLAQIRACVDELCESHAGFIRLEKRKGTP